MTSHAHQASFATSREKTTFNEATVQVAQSFQVPNSIQVSTRTIEPCNATSIKDPRAPPDPQKMEEDAKRRAMEWFRIKRQNLNNGVAPSTPISQNETRRRQEVQERELRQRVLESMPVLSKLRSTLVSYAYSVPKTLANSMEVESTKGSNLAMGHPGTANMNVISHIQQDKINTTGKTSTPSGPANVCQPDEDQVDWTLEEDDVLDVLPSFDRPANKNEVDNAGNSQNLFATKVQRTNKEFREGLAFKDGNISSNHEDRFKATLNIAKRRTLSDTSCSTTPTLTHSSPGTTPTHSSPGTTSPSSPRKRKMTDDVENQRDQKKSKVSASAEACTRFQYEEDVVDFDWDSD